MFVQSMKIALVFIVLWSTPAIAWGPNGHRVIGQIAENHLTEKARNEIASLVGRKSLAQISTWADEIKSDLSWRHASPWHYINVLPNKNLRSAPRNHRGDVIEAIQRFERVLINRKAMKRERLDALRFLVHLIGDIHQPLHVGYAADRGGNDIKVQWFGESTNLHAVWDEHLVEHQQLSFTEFVQFIGDPTPNEIDSWRSSTVWDWAQESRSLLPSVYNYGSSSSTSKIPSLGFAYVSKHNDVVKLRLLQAGIRLSGLLNNIFSSS